LQSAAWFLARGGIPPGPARLIRGLISDDNDGMTIDHAAPVAAAPRSRSRAAKYSRYAGFAAAWVLFITVARLIVPQSSIAAPGPEPLPRPAPAQAGHDLGTLAGHEYLVRIRATADGPRYTVCGRDGRIIRENLDAYSLARAFPALDLTTKQADALEIMSDESGE